MIEIILLALALSFVHFFSESYGYLTERYHSEFLSLSSGLFITFIFLFILPEVISGVSVIGERVFFLILAGFIFFHLSEKYIYQHVKNKNEVIEELAQVHAAGFFINHFVLGMTLYFIFVIAGGAIGLITFLLFLFHTISSSISLNHIDEYFSQRFVVNAILSSSPLLGVLFAIFLSPAKDLYYSLFALSVGAILYVVIRDMIPYGKEGKPLFFFFGFIISFGVIILAKTGGF